MLNSNINRVTIVCGHYGSGKTEFAVNYSIELIKKQNKHVAIADLDIVNPYFRTREKTNFLENIGIKVISSSIKGSAIDIPAVTGELDALILEDKYHIVIDVGGDHIGSKALARHLQYIRNINYDMLFVINAYRPETQQIDDIIYHLQAIENTTQLKITGLINNTHLLKQTSLEDVLFGQKIVETVSKKLNIPIKYLSCIEAVAKSLPENLKKLCITTNLIMREQWMS